METIAVDSNGQQMPWKEIVARAAHDMRTPLSSIRVTLEVLRMSAAQPDAQGKLIAMLDKQVDLIAGILETLSKDPGAFVTTESRGSEGG